MSEIMDDIAYLSQEIGPRPAGTEEEQQAAFYISDTMKNRTGFETNIEEFACNTKPDLVKVILCALTIVLSIVALITNIAVIPAILVGVLCAVFFVPEAIGKPLLSKLFKRGVSQNVVSKYQPAVMAPGRPRKVIIVANYDSGKIRKELGAVGALPVIDIATVVAMVAIPLIWILRAAFGMEASGPALIAWNVITVILLLIAVIPIVLFIMHQTAQYNEAANCNAASVAAMMEVAQRIAKTPVSAQEGADVQIHGEQAARFEGLIPEGAEISYDVAPTQAEETPASAASSQSAPEAERLASTAPAKEGFVYLDNQTGWPEEYSYRAAGSSEPVQESPSDEAKDESVPEWYAKAQAKARANRPADDGAPIRRSRFASALDQAVETSHQRAQEAAAAQEAARNAMLASAQEAARAAELASAHQGVSRVEAATPAAPVEQERGALAAEEVLPTPEAQPESENQFAAEQPALEFDNPLAELAREAVETALANGEDPYEGMEVPAVAEEPAEEEVSEQPETQQEPVEEALEQPEAPVEQAPVEQPAAVVETAEQKPEPVPATGTVAIPRIDVSELRREAAAARDIQPAEDSKQQEPVLSEAAIPQVPVQGDAEPEEHQAHLNPLLDAPELLADLPQIDANQHQRAPLAGDPMIDPSLSSRIPRVNLDAFGISTAGNAEPMDNKRAALRNMVPSVSGSISYESEDPVQVENNTVSRTGSFTPVGMSGSIGPVGDELIEGVDPDDIYVDDVDDSDYATNMTETGAYAGPGYVEMPESRVSRFFGKFRRKKKKEEVSAQEWLDVDKDFNPTKVGAERGSWESFNEDAHNRHQAEKERNEFDELGLDEDWNGGAFSKMRASLPKIGKKGGESAEEEQDVLVNDVDAEQEAFEPAAIEQNEAPVEDFAEQPVVSDEAEAEPVDAPAPFVGNSLAAMVEQLGLTEEDRAITTEIKQIEDFHLLGVNVEVWFVALGSECAANGGSKAFFEEHADELDGAMIVNLEGLGAGALAQVSVEGAFGSKGITPRMKRLVRKAQQVTGVTFTDARIKWKDSIASLALKKGLHAVTLAGIEKKKPAYMGQGDDVIENVDEEMLHRRIEFVEAFVRHA